MKQILTVWFTALLLTGVCSQCTNDPSDQKKVFYINSYHQGYGASDEIMQGLKDQLTGQNVVIETFFLDSKRNSSDDSIRRKVDQVLERIQAFNPRVIIASDDDAVKYAIVPYFKNTDMPVVFCGVNWTAEPYGLPADNVTGMVEILPVKATLDTLRHYYPKMRKMLVLTENTSTELKNAEALRLTYQKAGLVVDFALVNDFAAWKNEFIRGNTEFDLIYLSTNGAIAGWDVAEARKFVSDNIRKPVFSTDDFMMTYAVFGLTKISREQGEWAARTALEIMDGRDPAHIPLAQNRLTQAWINADLAEKIDFEPSDSLLKISKIVKWPGN
jgi:ABC-type uncharacterized transport system substrate-binding protein